MYAVQGKGILNTQLTVKLFGQKMVLKVVLVGLWLLEVVRPEWIANQYSTFLLEADDIEDLVVDYDPEVTSIFECATLCNDNPECFGFDNKEVEENNLCKLKRIIDSPFGLGSDDGSQLMIRMYFKYCFLLVGVL